VLRGRWRSERGVALVEFALVAPILFLALFGVLDFGKGFNYWIDETHLAAEGARLAAISGTNTYTATCPFAPNPTVTTIEAYIKCQADTTELRDPSNGATVTICFPLGPSGTSGKVGDPVQVRVSYDYNWIPLIGNAIGASGATTLIGQATMRLQNAWTGSPTACP
jgi:Flp pilus assembly protein TadG